MLSVVIFDPADVMVQVMYCTCVFASVINVVGQEKLEGGHIHNCDSVMSSGQSKMDWINQLQQSFQQTSVTIFVNCINGSLTHALIWANCSQEVFYVRTLNSMSCLHGPLCYPLW